MPKRKLIGISATAFAASVGVTYEAVMKRVKAGKFAETTIHPDGSFDEEKARVDWFARTNPSHIRQRPQDKPKQPRKSAAAHNEDAADKRAEHEVKLERMEVDLETAKINLTKLKETTVDKEVAKLATRSLMRTFRAAMLNFANRYAADIAAEIEADPVQLAAVLESTMRVALAELAKTRGKYDAGTFGESERG